jgi:hypothetical protein
MQHLVTRGTCLLQNIIRNIQLFIIHFHNFHNMHTTTLLTLQNFVFFFFFITTNPSKNVFLSSIQLTIRVNESCAFLTLTVNNYCST